MLIFILGDSAYAIESFLIPPYDLSNLRSPEDDFNFYHSNAYITVECAFIKLHMRWGIFWKPLACSLNNAAIRIEGTMRLRNYLVEYRDANLPPYDIDIERNIFQEDCTNSTERPIVASNNTTRSAGRPSNNDINQRLKGLRLRDKLRLLLKDHELYRQKKEWDCDKTYDCYQT